MKLTMATILVALLLALVGCEQPTSSAGKNTTTTISQNPVKVGDAIVGGFTVTQVDVNSTGYIATRDFKITHTAAGAAQSALDGYINDINTGYRTTKSAVQTYSNGSTTTGATSSDTKTYWTLLRHEGIISGTWTTDVSLTKDTEWTLAGPVFIGGDNTGSAKLYIDAGTIIKGTSSSIAPGMLVVSRGSQIFADGSKYYGSATAKSSPASVVSTDNGSTAVSVEGTYVLPIVFTSAKTLGSRAPGDWGGLVINGNAPVNDGDSKSGTAPYTSTGKDTGEGNTGYYGGSDADDNSGVLKYIRSEFAGVRFTADNELNGIAFQGVGRGTTVDYIQAHLSNDDGIEMFGGTVNMKHVVSTGNLDDYLDWTSGWTGAVQFMVGQQYPISGFDNGLEGDGKENDTTATPYSNPYLANFTMIGAGTASTDGTATPTKNAANFRRGTKVTLVNSAFVNFLKSFLETDVTGSAYISGTASGVSYRGVLTTMTSPSLSTGTFNSINYFSTAITGGATGTAWLSGTGTGMYQGAVGTDILLPAGYKAALTTPAATTIPDDFTAGSSGNLKTKTVQANTYTTGFQPTGAQSSSIVSSTVSSSVNGATLTSTSYIGAVDPSASTNWTTGWTTNAAN